MKKKLILPVILSLIFCFFKSALVKAKLNTYGAFYQTYINYHNSNVKKNGYASTVYLSMGNGINNYVQIGASYTHINYKTGSNLNQKDFTFTYTNTNQILKNHSFTLGMHYIKSDDTLTDNGYTLFFDITHFKYKGYLFRWSTGVGVFYSRYTKQTNFTVLQLTPHASFKIFADYKRGGLYADVLGYYIHVSNADRIGVRKSNNISLEGDIRYYYGKYDFKLGAWLGNQVFAVKNGGFVVYNLKEEYRGGILGGIGYSFTYRLRISFNLGVSRYEESGNKAIQTVGTFSIGYRF